MKDVSQSIAVKIPLENAIRGLAATAGVGGVLVFSLLPAEAFCNYLGTAGYAVGLAAAWIFLVMAIQIGLPPLARTLRKLFAGKEFNQVAGLLGSGIEMGGDLLIRTGSKDEPASVAADQLAEALSDGVWGMFIQRGNPEGLLFRGTLPPIVFHRSTGPDGWPVEAQVQVGQTKYEDETHAQYEADLKGFLAPYRAWVEKYKWEASDKSAHGFLQRARNAYTILFLCLSFVVAAQTKTDQVRAYLGDVRFETGKPKGQTKFVFENVTIVREGHGETFAELLPNGKWFSDEDNAGRLSKITINNIEVGRQISSKRTEMASAVPIPGITPRDSTTYAEKMEAIKRYGDLAGNELAEKGWLTWDAVFHWFGLFKFGLFVIMSLCFFVAWFGSNETMVNTMGRTIVGRKIMSIQQAFSHLTFGLLCLFGIVYLTQFAFMLSRWSIPTEIKMVVFFAAAWVVGGICSKIQPNIPVVGARSDDYGGGQRRIG